MSGKRTADEAELLAQIQAAKSQLEAAAKLSGLLADRGWTAYDLARESKRTGHPAREVSVRTVYRALSGYKPTGPVQFEIAATLGLLPSHIWGDRPMPVAVPEPEAVAC